MTSTNNGHGVDPRRHSARALLLAGVLLVGGLVGTVVATLFHPAGQEDVHEVIFADYAADDAWVAVHLAQFVAVLVTLGALLVLCDLLRRFEPTSVLARLAAATTVATAAAWALLQGLDGVGLKQAVDAWQAAPESERQSYFAAAETIRWLEWGFQSYFRLLLGTAFVLLGAALATGSLLPRWIGWAAIVTGAVSLWFGIDVGFSGLASSAQDVLSIAFLVLGLVFGIAVIAAGLRGRSRELGS